MKNPHTLTALRMAVCRLGGKAGRGAAKARTTEQYVVLENDNETGGVCAEGLSRSGVLAFFRAAGAAGFPPELYSVQEWIGNDSRTLNGVEWLDEQTEGV